MRANQTDQKRSISPTSQRAAIPASIMGPRLAVITPVAVLVVLGIVMVFSASSITAIDAGTEPMADLLRQMGYAAFGGAVCLALARIVPYRLWAGWLTWAVFGASLILLVLTAAIGTVGLGAQRWLTLGPVNLQPSEFAKIGVLLATAKLLFDYQEGIIRPATFFGLFGALNVVIVALIFVAQSDMGTTIICFLGIIAILWFGEVKGRIIALYSAIVAFLGILGLTAGYRWERLMSFTHPWDDYYGTGYQLIHSFYAFAQGGLFGRGIGGSAEKYQYLPEADTDFIFSIIGEEGGLVAAVAVIALFMVFLYGGLRMAQAAPDRFAAMLCGSFAVIIVFQAFLNIGCVIGLMPITGKPLPFISAGGSSMVASLAMVGIMLSVSHASDESPVYRQRRENLRVLSMDSPGSEFAGAPRRAGRTQGRPGRQRSYAPAAARYTPVMELAGRRTRRENPYRGRL